MDGSIPAFRNESKVDADMDSTIARLMENKHLVAESALHNFNAWDTDNSQALSTAELNNAYLSENADLAHRASAKILAENFDTATKMSTAEFDVDPDSYTKSNFNFLKNKFADDISLNISRKDINAFSSLSAVDGNLKFFNSAEIEAKKSLAFDAFLTTAFSANTLFQASKAMQMVPGVLKVGTSVFAAVSMCGTLTSADRVHQSIVGRDFTAMKDQFNRRKSMLDSWKAPES